MAYAAISDMVTRFGQSEMIRLSVPQGQPMDAIFAPPITLALGDASDLIDTYAGKRYVVPMTASVPASIARACCILARYDLSTGDGRDVSEQVRLARKEAISWLEDIAAGKVQLPLDEVVAGDASFAQMSDRAAIYGPGCDATSFPAVGPQYPFADQGGAPADNNTPLPPFWSEPLP